MITDEMLKEYGFKQLDDVLWTSEDWLETELKYQEEGIYWARCYSHQSYVKNEDDLKRFLKFVFTIANQK